MFRSNEGHPRQLNNNATFAVFMQAVVGSCPQIAGENLPDVVSSYIVEFGASQLLVLTAEMTWEPETLRVARQAIIAFLEIPDPTAGGWLDMELEKRKLEVTGEESRRAARRAAPRRSCASCRAARSSGCANSSW